jgi:hypothetical protein
MGERMTNGRDQAIRERAYALWEADGRPHGSDLLHWDQATAEIDREHTEVANPDWGEDQAESAIEVIEEAKIRKVIRETP